MSKGVVKG